MNVRELYEDKPVVLYRALRELRAGRQPLISDLGSPEVLQDDFLNEWLAFNYLSVTDFRADGSPIMGEIGGIIPTHPQNGKQILAVSEASVQRVGYGIVAIKEAPEVIGHGDAISEAESQIDAIYQIERQIEIPLEYRGNAIVVNGNRNAADYDFISGVAIENPFDLFTMNVNLLLAADRITVLSNKSLRKEQYIFNVPENPQLFEELRADSNYEERLHVMKSAKSIITPDHFIAGFRITYRGNVIRVTPVISEREAEAHSTYLKGIGLEPVSSNITYLGTSDPHGRFTVMERRLPK